MTLVQRLVSKKKRRFANFGYDLDMSYISDQIIAMGYPSESVEAMYRNPYTKVFSYFEKFHKDKYKVYNLCSERQYEPSKFHNRVECFPFDDHNAPPFELIFQFCESVKDWLDKDDENLALIHCKAGKGRTGVMICNWLMYSGEWNSPEDSMSFYAAMRTYNMKGVTIPSQIRYIHYFAKALVRQELPVTKYRPAKISKIILHTIPMVDGPIWFEFQKNKKVIYTYTGDAGSSDNVHAACKLQKARSKSDGFEFKDSDVLESNGCERLEFAVIGDDNDGFELEGDIYVQFYDGKPGKAEKLFHVWINSHFVDEITLMPKKTVDKAHKDKQHKIFQSNFHLQLEFTDLQEVEVEKKKIKKDKDKDNSRMDTAAQDLLNRRGHERNSRPGTLIVQEHILNAGSPPSIDAFFEKHGLDGLVDTSPCALAAYLCERATEALERYAETAVGGAALAAAASSSLAPTDENATSNSDNKSDKKKTANAAAAAASRLRMVGNNGMREMSKSASLNQLQEVAQMLQRVTTLPTMRHAERISFWLNVYNALSVHANCVYGPTTLRERLHTQLYYKYQIGDEKYSLAEIQIFMLRNTLPQSNQLERLLRERIEWRKKNAVLPGALLSAEPTITFCINHGVPAAGEIVPYWPDNIEEQLRRAARRYFTRLFRVDRKTQRALLPRMLQWVNKDFGRDRAERLAMWGELMEPDQRRALFECGKRASGLQYTNNDQTLGFSCPTGRRSNGSGGNRRKKNNEGRRHSSAHVARNANKKRNNGKFSMTVSARIPDVANDDNESNESHDTKHSETISDSSSNSVEVVAVKSSNVAAAPAPADDSLKKRTSKDSRKGLSSSSKGRSKKKEKSRSDN